MIGLFVAEARRLGIVSGYDNDAVNALTGKVTIGRMVPKKAFGPIISVMRNLGVIG